MLRKVYERYFIGNLPCEKAAIGRISGTLSDDSNEMFHISSSRTVAFKNNCLWYTKMCFEILNPIKIDL